MYIIATWFNKESESFWGLWVFDFAFYPNLETLKSFPLFQKLTLVVIIFSKKKEKYIGFWVINFGLYSKLKIRKYGRVFFYFKFWH